MPREEAVGSPVVVTVPSGQVVFDHVTPVRFAPVRFAPVRFAPVISSSGSALRASLPAVLKDTIAGGRPASEFRLAEPKRGLRRARRGL